MTTTEQLDTIHDVHARVRHDLHVGLRPQPARLDQAVREGEDVAVERDAPTSTGRSTSIPSGRARSSGGGGTMRFQALAEAEDSPVKNFGDKEWRPGRRRAAELTALAVHARRAGRAAVHRAHRRDGAVDRRQVLRGDAGDGRGAPRRGVRALPRREARQPVRHQRQPARHPRRHPPRPALGHRVPRHADHGRRARARGLRHDAQDHDRAAAQEAAALRDERRGPPRRVRRALVAGVLHGPVRSRDARAPGVRVRRRPPPAAPLRAHRDVGAHGCRPRRRVPHDGAA